MKPPGTIIAERAPAVAVERLPPAPARAARRRDQLVTAVIVVLPPAALVFAVVRFWARGVSWLDLVLLLAFYAVTGHGLSVGYHRLFAHRSFRPARWLKITLAIAGSLAVEGSVISWVALHRRHHCYADRPGDPHSPVVGSSPGASLRGLFHAHLGWLFRGEVPEAERWCPELLVDSDLVRISALAPAWVVVSLALPFVLGWALTRSVEGAWLALLWAGAVRIALVHHVTWSVNSLGHAVGRRPHQTKDRSSNVWPLAVLSFGDSWHNNHHAFPALARHGLGRGQVDSSAALIRLCERGGWAHQVRWPRPEVRSGASRRPAAAGGRDGGAVGGL